MEQIVRMLERPQKFFTADRSRYGRVSEYVVREVTPFFWEDECLMIYVRGGSGYLRANQTVYPLEPGCLCSLHHYHVFRLENTDDAPLELEIIIYPYPEMVYFITDYAESDLSFGESVVVFSPQVGEHAQIEQLLDIYREEEQGTDEDSRLLRLCLQDQLRRLYGAAAPVTPIFPMPLCGQIFLYVGLNSLRSLTAANVAEHFQLSTLQVSRELRRVCIESFNGVLCHAQVCNACTCLLRTNISGAMLAKIAGFKSESALYREFLRLRGATPQQYRQKMLQNAEQSDSPPGDQLPEIQVYVMENFQTPITCGDCAQSLFLTKSVINRLLGMKYGPEMTFHKFVNCVRLQFAEGLLVVSELPIYDVAMEAGFNSVHTFIRLFKQERGETPTQFRNRKKGAQK